MNPEYESSRLSGELAGRLPFKNLELRSKEVIRQAFLDLLNPYNIESAILRDFASRSQLSDMPIDWSVEPLRKTFITDFIDKRNTAAKYLARLPVEDQFELIAEALKQFIPKTGCMSEARLEVVPELIGHESVSGLPNHLLVDIAPKAYQTFIANLNQGIFGYQLLSSIDQQLLDSSTTYEVLKDYTMKMFNSYLESEHYSDLKNLRTQVHRLNKGNLSACFLKVLSDPEVKILLKKYCNLLVKDLERIDDLLRDRNSLNIGSYLESIEFKNVVVDNIKNAFTNGAQRYHATRVGPKRLPNLSKAVELTLLFNWYDADSNQIPRHTLSILQKLKPGAERAVLTVLREPALFKFEHYDPFESVRSAVELFTSEKFKASDKLGKAVLFCASNLAYDRKFFQRAKDLSLIVPAKYRERLRLNLLKKLEPELANDKASEAVMHSVALLCDDSVECLKELGIQYSEDPQRYKLLQTLIQNALEEYQFNEQQLVVVKEKLEAGQCVDPTLLRPLRLIGYYRRDRSIYDSPTCSERFSTVLSDIILQKTSGSSYDRELLAKVGKLLGYSGIADELAGIDKKLLNFGRSKVLVDSTGFKIEASTSLENELVDFERLYAQYRLADCWLLDDLKLRLSKQIATEFVYNRGLNFSREAEELVTKRYSGLKTQIARDRDDSEAWIEAALVSLRFFSLEEKDSYGPLELWTIANNTLQLSEHLLVRWLKTEVRVPSQLDQIEQTIEDFFEVYNSLYESQISNLDEASSYDEFALTLYYDRWAANFRLALVHKLRDSFLPTVDSFQESLAELDQYTENVKSKLERDVFDAETLLEGSEIAKVVRRLWEVLEEYVDADEVDLASELCTRIIRLERVRLNYDRRTYKDNRVPRSHVNQIVWLASFYNFSCILDMQRGELLTALERIEEMKDLGKFSKYSKNITREISVSHSLKKQIESYLYPGDESNSDFD